MATTATQSNPIKPKEGSSNPADVRAAAMAVLRLADERTADGRTAAKHRSPVPTASPPPRKRTSAPVKGSSKNTAAAKPTRGSFSFMQSFRNQMSEVKVSMNRLDEKFLSMQFEQEDKMRKAYDKTTSDWSGMLSPAKKKPAQPNAPTTSAAAKPESLSVAAIKGTVQREMKASGEELQSSMSRFRSSFQGFTQNARKQLNLQQEEQPKNKPDNMDETIVAELEQLHEKMTLCHSLLAARDAEKSKKDYVPDPQLSKAIKFLESCLGRMDQLMEAGIDGQFQDDTTQICVSTYERLILTLEKCHSPLVKSNAFAFTKDLEGDAEFDEVTPLPTPDRSGTLSTNAAKSTKPAAAVTAPVESTPAEGTPDLPLHDLDTDLNLDLAAFEIGSDDEENILNVTNLDEYEKKVETEGEETTPTSESNTSDDDFVKDVFG